MKQNRLKQFLCLLFFLLCLTPLAIFWLARRRPPGRMSVLPQSRASIPARPSVGMCYPTRQTILRAASACGRS